MLYSHPSHLKDYLLFYNKEIRKHVDHLLIKLIYTICYPACPPDQSQVSLKIVVSYRINGEKGCHI